MRNMPAEAILCPANSRGKKNQGFYHATGQFRHPCIAKQMAKIASLQGRLPHASETVASQNQSHNLTSCKRCKKTNRYQNKNIDAILPDTDSPKSVQMRPDICENLRSSSKALVVLMNTLTFGEQLGQMNPPSPTSSATLLPHAHEPRPRRKTMAYAGADDEAQKLFGYDRALSLSLSHPPSPLSRANPNQGLCEQSPNKVQRLPKSQTESQIKSQNRFVIY